MDNKKLIIAGSFLLAILALGVWAYTGRSKETKVPVVLNELPKPNMGIPQYRGPIMHSDYMILTDTLYARQDTVKVKYLISNSGGNQLSRIYGYQVRKQYIGRRVADQIQSFFFNQKWDSVNTKNVENVVEFKWDSTFTQ